MATRLYWGTPVTIAAVLADDLAQEQFRQLADAHYAVVPENVIQSETDRSNGELAGHVPPTIASVRGTWVPWRESGPFGDGCAYFNLG